ncbi:F-box DNA helicase 1-like [Aphis craccivora]|uniref:F-box DNA helicase 1-like n=1 Tax=Aphis craccivora TaxID=307492 RepID=A0A6G0Y7N4_APHCR|nr:F-box DNA helicase 1-like [Aphis craccivora]
MANASGDQEILQYIKIIKKFTPLPKKVDVLRKRTVETEEEATTRAKKTLIINKLLVNILAKADENEKTAQA